MGKINKGYKMRKRRILMMVFLCMGLLYLQITNSFAYLDESKVPTPTTLYVGGEGPGNFSCINDALRYARDGDTIFVYSGSYIEYIYVSKSVKLIGEDKNSTVVGNPWTDAPAVTIKAPGVFLSNFSLRAKNTAVIKIYSDYNIIKNNIIEGTGSGGEVGIKLIKAYKNLITDNVIKDIDRNFEYWEGGNGIEVIDSSYNIICNNTIIYSEWSGVLCTGKSNFNIIERNIFKNNYRGILLEPEYDNYQDLLMELKSNEIKNNIFQENTYGIHIKEAGSTRIVSNVFERNQYGVYIKRTLRLTGINIIAFNNFISNDNQSTFHYNTICHADFWIHNYWDDWLIPVMRPVIGRWKVFTIPYPDGYGEPVYSPIIKFDPLPAIRPFYIPLLDKEGCT